MIKVKLNDKQKKKMIIQASMHSYEGCDIQPINKKNLEIKI